MAAEEKAKAAAQAVRDLNHPLLPAAAKAALVGMAAAVEALAHEVEILKLRAGGGAGDVVRLDIPGAGVAYGTKTGGSNGG